MCIMQVLEPFFVVVVAIDPACINIGILERTEPNLIHLKLGSMVKR